MTTTTTVFTFTRVASTWGPTYITAHDGAVVGQVYRTGRHLRVWRATGTRGSYRTRHAAACAALAQRDARAAVVPCPRCASDDTGSPHDAPPDMNMLGVRECYACGRIWRQVD